MKDGNIIFAVFGFNLIWDKGDRLFLFFLSFFFSSFSQKVTSKHVPGQQWNSFPMGYSHYSVSPQKMNHVDKQIPIKVWSLSQTCSEWTSHHIRVCAATLCIHSLLHQAWPQRATVVDPKQQQLSPSVKYALQQKMWVHISVGPPTFTPRFVYLAVN